jgi:hypothetical protein
MPIRSNLSTDLLVRYVTVSGTVTPEELRCCLDESLRDQGAITPLGFVDLSQLEDCLLGFHAVRDLARVAQSLAARGDHRVYEVVLAPGDLAFGLARMYQTLVADEFDVRVFRAETDARTALEHARGGILALQGS